MKVQGQRHRLLKSRSSETPSGLRRMAGQNACRPQLQANHAAQCLSLWPSSSPSVSLIYRGYLSRPPIAGIAIPVDTGLQCKTRPMALADPVRRIAVVLERPCMTRRVYHHRSLPLADRTVRDMLIRHGQFQNAFDESRARATCPIRPPHAIDHRPSPSLCPRRLVRLCQMGPPSQNGLRRSFANDTNSGTRVLSRTRRYGKHPQL